VQDRASPPERRLSKFFAIGPLGKDQGAKFRDDGFGLQVPSDRSDWQGRNTRSALSPSGDPIVPPAVERTEAALRQRRAGCRLPLLAAGPATLVGVGVFAGRAGQVEPRAIFFQCVGASPAVAAGPAALDGRGVTAVNLDASWREARRNSRRVVGPKLRAIRTQARARHLPPLFADGSSGGRRCRDRRGRQIGAVGAALERQSTGRL
jgi:hypothetical protein